MFIQADHAEGFERSVATISKQIKADLLLLTITICWGSSFILMKNVLESTSVSSFLAVRFIVATVVLLPVIYGRRKEISPRVLWQSAFIGLMLFGSLIFQVYGLQYIAASTSAFITSLYVVMVPIASLAFIHKRLEVSSVTGVIFALTGLFFLCGGIRLQCSIGNGLTFLSAVCSAFQILLIDRYTKDESPVLLGAFQVMFCALFSTVAWIATGLDAVVWNSSVITAVTVTGLLCTAFAFIVQAVVQQFTSPTHTALIFVAEPVFGTIFAMIIPDSQGVTEGLTFNMAVGSILMMGGMLISELNLANKIHLNIDKKSA